MFRTRKIKCGDGRVVYVYRNPDKAVPLALKGEKRSAKAAVEGLESVKANAGIEHEVQIDAILIKLNAANGSLMAEFYLSYIAFSSDPCHKPGYLQERIADLSQDRMALDTAIVKAGLLEKLLKKGAAAADINQAIKETLSALVSPLAGSVAAGIKQAPKQIDAWAEQ
jgi:hypothetical protein